MITNVVEVAMTSQASINEFLAQRTLAIAGVKRDGRGFGNAVLKDLTGKGYEILDSA